MKICDLPEPALALAMFLGATFDTTVHVLQPPPGGGWAVAAPDDPSYPEIPLVSYVRASSDWAVVRAGYNSEVDVFVVEARGDDWRDWEGDSSE